MSRKIRKMEYEDDIEELLRKHFAHSSREGYVFVGDENVVMPIFYPNYEKDIDEFEIYDSDVFVASHPKAGTTWTQEMVWLMGNNLDYKGAQTYQQQRFPYLEVSAIHNAERQRKLGEPEYRVDSIGFVKKLQHPRFIKTHLPWQMLPRQIQNGEKRPKIIYVTRNAKDVCVSYYHHCRLLGGFTGGLEDFCKMFLAGKLTYSPFWSHIGSYLNNRHLSNLLILKYEDLKSDLPKQIKKVSAFLGKQLTEEEIERLAHHLSFDSMKKNPAVNAEHIVNMKRKNGESIGDGHFLRAGIVGKYKTEMSPDVVAEFDSWIEQNTKDTDWQL